MKAIKKNSKAFVVMILSAVMIFGSFTGTSEMFFGDSMAITAYADIATNQNLRRGSRGNSVKQLQQALNSLGYNCGTADGIFGANTESAVKRFQRDNRLIADGIAGRNTLNAINNKLRSKSSIRLNRQQFLNYARKYWNTRNNNYNYYNNNNCCNFASQCLVAAGMPTNNTFRNGSSAFVYIPSFKNYLVNNCGVKYIYKPSVNNIQVGDILYTSSSHVMVVTAKNGNAIYASGNTNNRNNLRIYSSNFYAVLKTSDLMR